MVTASIAGLVALFSIIDKLFNTTMMKNVWEFFSTKSTNISKISELEDKYKYLLNRMAEYFDISSKLSSEKKLEAIKQRINERIQADFPESSPTPGTEDWTRPGW